VNIEAGPDYVSSCRFIHDTTNGLLDHGRLYPHHDFFFHANHYQTLDYPQFVSKSSYHRLKRSEEIVGPISSKSPFDSILDILSDQENLDYPIFKNEMTLATVMFDVVEKCLLIYQGLSNKKNIIKKFA
jgi:hypothetical protein